jgi:NlpC/P60 family
MPENRRSRRLLAYALAVPIIAVAYAAAFGSRIWNVLRPFVATVMGATVIGGVYADEALRRAPATPIRAAAVFALAVVLVSPNVAPTPVYAADDPAQAVIAAAKNYLNHPYQSGAQGPRYFDCSGLVFRAFSDAGELPRIGGMRLLSQGYMRWFVSRGLFTTDESQAVAGDLVVWNNGRHIGIYLGDGKAISALINPWGVTIHGLHWIGEPVTYFLKIDYSNGSGSGDGTASGGGTSGSDNTGNGNGNTGNGNTGNGNTGNGNTGNGNTGNANNPGNTGNSNTGNANNPGGNANNPGGNASNPSTQPVTPNTNPQPGNPLAGGNQGSVQNGGLNGTDFDVITSAGDAQPPATSNTAASNAASPSGKGAGKAIATGVTTATLEIHDGPHADDRVIGYITRNVTFEVVDQAKSGGWPWLEIRMLNGKTGWIWAYWTALT